MLRGENFCREVPNFEGLNTKYKYTHEYIYMCIYVELYIHIYLTEMNRMRMMISCCSSMSPGQEGIINKKPLEISI